MKVSKTKITIRIEEDLLAWVDALSPKVGRNRSNFIRNVLHQIKEAVGNVENIENKNRKVLVHL